MGSVATSYAFEVNGTTVYVISKLPKEDYLKLISSCDVVVALIYSAHPGVIAWQAAASGMPTVTNTFVNRDAAATEAISSNIVAYDPLRDRLCAKIEEALLRTKGTPSFNPERYSVPEPRDFNDFVEGILKEVLADKR